MRGQNRSAESGLVTEERRALGRRTSKRFARSLFWPQEQFFKTAPPCSSESGLSNSRDHLRGVAERGGLEEILKRPAAGQVNADATSCFADARPDLEQLNA